jgi:glycosyltransferase involved in cell wall biosynthesis
MKSELGTFENRRRRAAILNLGSATASEHERLWIAWETQRRSLTLSRRVGARLHIFEHSSIRAVRYILAGLKTLRLLWKSRNRIVFVQNPSMVLASLACLMKSWFGYWLVVDRHSDFLADGTPRHRAIDKVLSKLNAYTLRRADLTIVTNRELSQKVLVEGGRPFVLPDPFPDPISAPYKPPCAGLTILFVCSWAADEPIVEVVEACRALQGHVTVYASGKPKKKYEPILRAAPPNFVCTGFLPDSDYFRLMAGVDAVIAITRRRATLVCGAYEAISLGKPLILGDSDALREYFDRGALYSDCSPGDLARQLVLLGENLGTYTEQIKELYEARAQEWERALGRLNSRLDDMVNQTPRIAS